MSMSGTPTEFLELGILEPTDTLNTLVDLNGQWRKVDTGVKDVNTKADTNASNITSLNTQVHDNTENITNILDTNVNQQDDIDLLKTKVETLETHDGDYETRITNNTNGVQENSELINDLEEDVSGIHLSIGTVPEGETVEGQIGGIDTRVTALENSGTVEALETRVGRVEDSLGTVPSGSTVQGQIDDIVSDVGSVPSGSTVQGQIDSIDSQLTGTLSGNDVPFRFSIDGEGNYGYLKADDSFVPFRSGGGLTPYPSGYTLNNSDYNFRNLLLFKPYVKLRNSNNENFLYDIANDRLYPNGSYFGCRFTTIDGSFGDVVTNTSLPYEANTLYVFSGEHVNKFVFNGTTITRTYNGQSYTLTTTTEVILSRLYHVETNDDGSSITLWLSPTTTSSYFLTISGITSSSASITRESTTSSTWVYAISRYYGMYPTYNNPCILYRKENSNGEVSRVDTVSKCFDDRANMYVIDVTPSNNQYMLYNDGYLTL